VQLGSSRQAELLTARAVPVTAPQDHLKQHLGGSFDKLISKTAVGVWTAFSMGKA
jgi:hypothetical protein